VWARGWEGDRNQGTFFPADPRELVWTRHFSFVTRAPFLARDHDFHRPGRDRWAMNRIMGGYVVGLGLACGLLGCKNPPTRPRLDPPPPGVQTTAIDFVDSEGFDNLFESALVNQDPAIVIHTGRSKPDWGPRLNAWIAAWNRGGKVNPATVRGQIPGVPIDGDSIKEFRLLVSGLMDRVEDLAKNGSAWYAEERIRSRRVALLKPYNLRFHMDQDGNIQLIFFNGNYSSFYSSYVQSLKESAEPESWSRSIQCSFCKQWQAKNSVGHLADWSADRKQEGEPMGN